MYKCSTTQLTTTKPTTTQDVCHTESDGPSAGANKPCIFPFRYDGISYNTCTYVNSDNENKPWCSTRVDNNRNHVPGGGHYGNCGPKCPNAKCDPDQFECQSGICKYTDNKYCNGPCIRNSWVNDGEADCTDGSDEGELLFFASNY